MFSGPRCGNQIISQRVCSILYHQAFQDVKYTNCCKRVYLLWADPRPPLIQTPPQSRVHYVRKQRTGNKVNERDQRGGGGRSRVELPLRLEGFLHHQSTVSSEGNELAWNGSAHPQLTKARVRGRAGKFVHYPVSFLEFHFLCL